jgi:putative flippase GtrA
MAVAASGLVLNGIILTALIAAGLHFLVAQIAATTAVLFWNFCINRMWTFRRSAADIRL